MNLLKNKFILTALLIILILISASIGALATYNYLASDIKYTDTLTVEDALNNLYVNKNGTIITSELVNGIGNVSYTFLDDYRAACVYVYDGYNSGST